MGMLSRVCWGFCNMAHEAGADDNFPAWMRWMFSAIFGEFWYWAAMILQGNALAAIKERIHEWRLSLSGGEQTAAASFA